MDPKERAVRELFLLYEDLLHYACVFFRQRHGSKTRMIFRSRINADCLINRRRQVRGIDLTFLHGLPILVRLPVNGPSAYPRAGQCHLDEPPHLFQFFFFNPPEGVKPFDFAADAAIETRGVKAGDARNPADSSQKVLPAFLRADAQRADQSNTRDNYPASQLFHAPC